MMSDRPELKFEGEIVYIRDVIGVQYCCAEILSASNVECNQADDTAAQSCTSSGNVSVASNLLCGFDCEWPVTYTSVQAPVALVQVCTGPSKCYLFHLSSCGFPIELKRLLCARKLKKIGVNISGDIWKLARDVDLPGSEILRSSCIDLGKFANKTLNSAESWSLDGLVRHVLKHRLWKEADGPRTGDWSAIPLSDQQQIYAATDAWASLAVYQALIARQRAAVK